MDKVNDIVDEQDFKVRYNQMLQQFKQLKERQKTNQARHRQLNEQLDAYEKKNVDLMIKIKMIESELNGASQSDIASLFEVQIKAKTDKIAQLQAKKIQQAQTAKRKNQQNQAIIAKLKNTIKQKESLLNEKETEYNQTISATSQLTTRLQSSPQENVDFEKKKHELEDRLAQVEAQLKEQTDKTESLKKQLNQNNQGSKEEGTLDLEAKAKELQQLRAEEQANQRAIIKQLENQITSGSIVKQVAEKYEPLIKEAETKRATAMQQIEKLRETASQEEQQIVALNRQIKETSDKIKDYKRLKQQVQRSNKEIAKLRKEQQIQKGRIVNNSNKIQSTQQQIGKLQAQSNELKNKLKAARQRNESLKKQNNSAQLQLTQLKSKINKNDPKQYETLKRQKQSLENQLNREKNRYQALRQLQKTYYPESALKDLKATYEQLRQKTLNLPTLQKENKKLKQQYAQVQRKIDELKQRDQQTIDELSSQSKQLQIKIEQLERTHAAVSKTLNETNMKVTAYTKNFPNHEQDKQKKKLQQKRQQDERNKQKRQKNKNFEQQGHHQKLRSSKKLKVDDDDDEILGNHGDTQDVHIPIESTTQIKSNIQQYEYLGLIGLVVLAIVIYIFR